MLDNYAQDIANQLRHCFDNKRKCLVMGNGGSAQQANHFVAELVHEKLPAISLMSDISVITATANDFGYENVFANQVIALGQKGDILIGFSSSGTSKNILLAYDIAIKQGLQTIDFPRIGKDPQQIQENHLKLLHLVWQLLKQ